MRLTPDSEAQDIPDWKKKLVEEARKLIDARNAVQAARAKLVQEWLDTQPPEIKDTTIGK